MAEILKLTQAVVRGLQSESGKQIEVRDMEQTGFGVRVGSSGRKVFFVMRRVNGRMVRATVGKFPEMNLEDARKKARRMLVDMSEGLNPNDERKESRADSLMLESVFKSFMAARKNLSVSTRHGYEGVFGRYLGVWKSRNVGSISTQMVLDLHAEIGEGRGKNVANQSMRLLRTVLNYSRAVNGSPKVNPAAVLSEARAWYEDGRRSVIIRAEDMPTWLAAVNALDSDTGKDYLLLTLFAGLRRNEGMGLTWDDVDLENRTLTVRATKNKTDHTLPLSSPLYDLLTARKERWNAVGYVFQTWSGSGHLTNVEHIIKDVRKCGVPFTLHDLRRTFVTTAEALDISTYVVKRLANHTQSDVTGKHYVIHDIDRLREPMERIAAAMLNMAKTEA